MGLKIAILGTRGIPNNYGGFEHIAGYLARGLVERNHDVTVYNSNRHPYQKKEWHGVRIVHCFDPEHIIGIAGQFVYDLNCILHARGEEYDIILMLGYTSSSIWGLLYPKKPVIITNMDGLEWQRTKYSKPVRRFLRYAEKLAVHFSRFHIADSPVIRHYLDKKYQIHSRYISYGAERLPVENENLLAEFGLKKYTYFLVMARMEPENNIKMILDGYCSSASNLKFVVIGNTANRFGRYLVARYAHDKRIIFTGGIFNDEKVQSLTAYCRLYFHGHSAGGTNPSLLDAMAARVPIAAHENPFNQSVLKTNARMFKNASDVCDIINSGEYDTIEHINNNYAKIINEHSWELIIDQYESYFIECLRKTNEYYPLSHEKRIAYKGQY